MQSRGVRKRLETEFRNELAATLAHAIPTACNPGERRVDLRDRLQRLGRQREFALAVDSDGPTFTRLLVELDVSRLHLGNEQLRLRLQGARLFEVGRPLALEHVALVTEEAFLCIARARCTDRRRTGR